VPMSPGSPTKPLHDPIAPPERDPPNKPMHDPPGDPTFEPPQPLTEPTPNPASDPPPEMPGDPQSDAENGSMSAPCVNDRISVHPQGDNRCLIRNPPGANKRFPATIGGLPTRVGLHHLSTSAADSWNEPAHSAFPPTGRAAGRWPSALCPFRDHLFHAVLPLPDELWPHFRDARQPYCVRPSPWAPH
jgi:hypothetical protein